MERTVRIDDKDVKFKATGATIRIYRQMFRRDILEDMDKLQKEATDGKLSAEALEMFENMAFVMAKQADPSIPDTADEWLDGFSMFSLYQILPEIIALWGLSSTTLSDSKKKALAQTDL